MSTLHPDLSSSATRPVAAAPAWSTAWQAGDAALSTSQLAKAAARNIADAFDAYRCEFRAITQRAADRFRSQNWRGMAVDARLRLSVRAGAVDAMLEAIRCLLGTRLEDRLVWISAKAVFSGLVEQRDDWELAETFFNSATRRVFATVGVDSEIEFVHTDHTSPPKPAASPVFRTYQAETWTALVAAVVCDHPELALSEQALREGAAGVAARLARRCPQPAAGQWPTADVVATPFFRGERAYLVGRVPAPNTPTQWLPLVLCFHHAEGEPGIDAVLLDEVDVRLLFSYTRSYFHVDAPRPYDLVQFLKTIMPHKSRAEIYIAIGSHKHGKTELYRHALRHLAASSDCYERAPGTRGLVMVVFTMPSYPVVFKIIKDVCEYPKDCTRREVIDRYRLVFEHDRAGRLIDAQEYKYLALARRRFAPELLDELLAVAADAVRVEGEQVVIKHCYAERRVTPLDVFIRQAPPSAARAAVIDYGLAIKELAVTNLFPGDLLLKNFGVTRQGRVVFYDYDEVRLLTTCRFYHLPPADDAAWETAGEPWFGVAEGDVFPEEFIHFLGLPSELEQVFCHYHGDLLTPEYWLHVQRRLNEGELYHVPPYAEANRLPRRREPRHVV